MSLLPSLPNLDALSSLGSALDSSTQIANSPSKSSSIGDILGGIATGNPYTLGSGISSATGTQGALASIGSTLSWGRVAAFVIGIILIGGGILMFKQTQVIISGTAKTAAKVAAL